MSVNGRKKGVNLPSLLGLYEKRPLLSKQQGSLTYGKGKKREYSGQGAAPGNPAIVIIFFDTGKKKACNERHIDIPSRLTGFAAKTKCPAHIGFGGGSVEAAVFAHYHPGGTITLPSPGKFFYQAI